MLPPTKGAGNIDTRHLTAGTKLSLGSGTAKLSGGTLSLQGGLNVQQAIPANVAGSRIHTPAVLTDAIFDSTDRYQSNGASVVPKYR